jgi:aryl-alcohol dehydrogenase-like predicted oxidoreductase
VKKRRLGSEGPGITTVGFGAWAVGGPWQFGWGEQDDDDSVAAIRTAVEAGVNWVDTAAVYGLGHSEEVVARALEPFGVGDQVLVFTKCGRNWYGSDGESIEYDLRPDSIRFECEQSLKRLGVERIDLYQFHWPDPVTGTQVEDSWGAMGELIDEGKVRWGGVSNFDVELLERCEAVRHVDSLQPPLSLIRRGAASEVIPWCRDHGTGVIGYSPMASGLLTGRFDHDRLESLQHDDWRRHSEAFQEPQFSRTMALVDRLEPIAERLGTNLPSLAIAWTLSVPGVTAAIVGARTPEQVEEWLGAGDIDLGDDDIKEIELALDETGVGAQVPYDR